MEIIINSILFDDNVKARSFCNLTELHDNIKTDIYDFGLLTELKELYINNYDDEFNFPVYSKTFNEEDVKYIKLLEYFIKRLYLKNKLSNIKYENKIFYHFKNNKWEKQTLKGVYVIFVNEMIIKQINTIKNSKSVIDITKKTLILFYKYDCYISNALFPIWFKLKHLYKTKYNFLSINMDMVKYEKIIEIFDIKKTSLLCLADNNIYTFNGKLNTDDIIDFINNIKNI